MSEISTAWLPVILPSPTHSSPTPALPPGRVSLGVRHEGKQVATRDFPGRGGANTLLQSCPLAHHRPSGGWRWAIFRPHSAMLTPHLPSWGDVGWGNMRKGRNAPFPPTSPLSAPSSKPPPGGCPTSHSAILGPSPRHPSPSFFLLKQLVVGKAEHLLQKDRHGSTKNQEAVLEPGI